MSNNYPSPEGYFPAEVLDINARLTKSYFPHAFGGAVALAFYSGDEQRRITQDIDVNVYIPNESVEYNSRTAGYTLEVAAGRRLGQEEFSEYEKTLERQYYASVKQPGAPKIDVFFAATELHRLAVERKKLWRI